MSDGSIVLISKRSAPIDADVVVVVVVVVVDGGGGVFVAAVQSSPLISQSCLNLPQSKLLAVKSE